MFRVISWPIMWDKITQSPLIDLLDILIVAYLLYRLIVFIKDTRVIQMFAGLGFLLVLSFLASSLGMIVVNRIIDNLKTIWVIAFIIIFQPELRSGLTNLGLRRGFGLFRAPIEIPAEEEILQAASRLSKRGLGALVVIEREVKLNDWILKGVPLGAEITAALLETIFTPPGPLHDGAVIISQGKIAAAAVVLPISEQEELGYVLGTRHRAAIGISELSDCVVIVVSEESRAISIVHEGHIKRGLSQEDLAMELKRIYRVSESGAARNRRNAQPNKSDARDGGNTPSTKPLP